MRWRLRLSVLLGVAVMYGWPGGYSSACAQSGNRGHSALIDRPAGIPIQPGLVVRSGAAKFQMILGRLSLHPPSHIECSRSAPLESGDGTESLEVQATRGIPSLHYVLRTPERRVVVDVTQADQVTIDSEIRGANHVERLIVQQPESGPLSIRLQFRRTDGSTERDDKITSPSLVHFREVDPRCYDRHLTPLFDQIFETAPYRCDTRDLVAAAAGTFKQYDDLYAQTRHWVDRLLAPTVLARTEAERALIGIGLPALPLIQSIHAADFDAEQRSRLRRIERAISPHTPDTPKQLARWLATDITYWRLVAHRLSAAHRQAVVEPLVKLTGHELEPAFAIAEARGEENTY